MIKTWKDLESLLREHYEWEQAEFDRILSSRLDIPLPEAQEGGQR